ncbi:MarR family transcriptional regulator [Aliishimia ponticola]|uniref:MarR family transcriptional regulator n=1 Tax=Aliishimia ponticola TaxID=2499833 RepID=A0A4S4N5R6_9RHOB|nr:MarR family winged helix-turn-helix transcriptional regulator [Aliishimia ponticola]THH34446.1 MarR family transcriptional regulator [Aliishimia ponticola]
MQQDNPDKFKENWPFFWVTQINAAYANVLEKRIKPLGVDLPRWRAMMSLYEDEYLSVSEIAEFSAQKLNTTTKVIQRMLSDGLVSTRVRPSDGRVTEVCLTDKGERLRKDVFVEAQDIFESTFGTFSSEELNQLNSSLSQIHRRLKKL